LGSGKAQSETWVKELRKAAIGENPIWRDGQE